MKVVLFLLLLVFVMSLQAGTLLTSDKLTVDQDNPSPLTVHEEPDEEPEEVPMVTDSEDTES